METICYEFTKRNVKVIIWKDIVIGVLYLLKEDILAMKLLLIIGVCLMFLSACFTSAYEAKPGVPKKNQ